MNSIIKCISLFLLLITTTVAFSEEKQKDIYIPKDVKDCIKQLLKIKTPEDIEKLKSVKEEDLWQYHHGFGSWIRNEWNLWHGSILKDYFNKKGIYHPDDMSGIIIKSFWRHLNKKPILLWFQIRLYKKHWVEEGTIPFCGAKIKGIPEATCTICSSKIVLSHKLLPNKEKGLKKAIFVGYCKKEGDSHCWCYIKKQGWFIPKGELKEIVDPE